MLDLLPDNADAIAIAENWWLSIGLNTPLALKRTSSVYSTHRQRRSCADFQKSTWRTERGLRMNTWTTSKIVQDFVRIVCDQNSLQINSRPLILDLHARLLLRQAELTVATSATNSHQARPHAVSKGSTARISLFDLASASDRTGVCRSSLSR
jgi:hypothetical protein